MIYTGTLLRAELYDDHVKPYTNVKAVYEAHKNKYPGKLIVTNGHWYNTKPVTPCGNYKVDGTVLSTEEWMDWGFGWNSGQIPVMVSTMDDNDNYLSTLPLLVGGKKRDDVIKQQQSNVTLSTLRTWFGVDAAGRWTVEVTTSGYTLDGIVERMQSLGIVDGMVLDGSGSSQCYDGKTYQKGDGRDLYSFLLLWFADDGGTGGDDTDDDKEEAAGMKIYLSPSAQPANNYAAGDTNEQVQCNRIAEAAKTALERCGFTVRKAPEGQEYKDNVSESNAWGAELHIPIHTNAGGGAGTVVFVHGGTAKQMQYAQPIYDEVQAISPGTTNYGVRVNSGLYELKYTTATAVYVECEFHDRADLATWIIGHTAELGEAIARGICKGAGVRYIAPAASEQPEPDMPETELAREWAMATGISDGENPDSPCTREQAWVMLYRLTNGGNNND
ncbi:MAG: N-acetylmuramoyl-L-alanine amidase [Oscillospiraceae bacterium]